MCPPFPSDQKYLIAIEQWLFFGWPLKNFSHHLKNPKRGAGVCYHFGKTTLIFPFGQ
jgi:hypothetical protein